MLIVDYDTFIRMPAGTIFAPYEPCAFMDRFEIKVDHGEEWNGKWGFIGTMPLEPCLGVNGPFDFGQWDTELAIYDGDSNDASEYKMFAVLEKHEVERLIGALWWALKGCAGDLDDYLAERKAMTDALKSILGMKENENA